MALLNDMLDDLANRINPEKEEALFEQWMAHLRGETKESYFLPDRGYTAAPSFEWPKIIYNETIDDFEKMAMRELQWVNSTLENGTPAVLLNVRANWGPGILASLFGTRMTVLDDHYDTAPQARHFESYEEIEALMEQGVPDLRAGYGKYVLDMGVYFKDLFKDYPVLEKYIYVYHPDLQGPIDNLELIWGSGLFIDVFEKPDAVHKMLNIICDTYIAMMNEWYTIYPKFSEDVSVHWGHLIKGQTMVRNDSAMNFSPEMYDEFIKPYDKKVLDALGGGIVHFCGKGDHYVPTMCEIDSLYGINMSQPEYNDMEVIYQNTVDKGLFITGLPYHAAEEADKNGRSLKGYASTFK